MAECDLVCFGHRVLKMLMPDIFKQPEQRHKRPEEEPKNAEERSPTRLMITEKLCKEFETN